MTTLKFVLLLLAGAFAVHAQQIRPLPSARTYGDLQKLNSLTSVLYIAAHPDDENTRLLSWIATGRNIRTGYLSLTRGDGGQNIIGAEQGAALGLIRTHELLAARRLDGAEQYFTRALDFGFAKNSRETLKQWDSVILIADVIRVIREFRPDVVICRFPKDSMAGHGQHSASAIIAEEAVRYCYGTSSLSEESKARIDSILKANPSITGEELWRPKRTLFNAFRFGNRSTIKPGTFKLDIGQYDPLIGMGYGELAGISRSIHRSQGAGTPSTPGVQPEFFETLIGDSPTQSLFDGIDTTWTRIGAADIGSAIDSVIQTFDMRAPQKSLDKLLDIRAKIHQINDPFWNQQKGREIDRVIFSCIGLTADISVPASALSAGDTSRATLRFITRANRTVTVMPITMPGGAMIDGFVSTADSLHVVESRVSVPLSAPITQPYWLTFPADRALFRVSSEYLLGSSVSAPSIEIPVIMTIGFETFVVMLPLSHKRLDPLKGDVIEELRIVPPVSIEPINTVVFSKQGIARCAVKIRAFAEVMAGSLVVHSASRELYRVNSIAIKPQTDTLLVVDVPVNATSDVTIGFEIGSRAYNSRVVVISYDHIPTLQYLEPVRIRVIAEQVMVSSKKVAFVMGAGEHTLDVLKGIDVQVDEGDDDLLLRTQDLLAYDAVVVGIRALNVRRNVKYLMPSLLRYAELGGTLILQYNTLQELATTDFAPYPLSISRNRVTEEDAPVTILRKDHRVFNSPNSITQQDFDGWVQERSVYNPGPYDKKYVELLETHDEGDGLQKGSLLYTPYGKGHYVYTSLALFRQLPAGVVGAIKLMANLISLK